MISGKVIPHVWLAYVARQSISCIKCQPEKSREGGNRNSWRAVGIQNFLDDESFHDKFSMR